MSLKNILTLTEARSDIFNIADKIAKAGSYFTLTQYGKPKVVMMSAEDFESWQETIEVIKEMPKIREDIKKSREEYKQGNYVTLDKLLEKEGYILASK